METTHNYKLLKFQANWCFPCKSMKPIVEKVLEDFNNIDLIEVDVDFDTDLATEYKIRSIPSFILLKDNEIVGRLTGAIPAEKFKEFLIKNT